MDVEKIIEVVSKYLPEEEITEHTEYYTMPTICHNHSHKEASKKLYLYKNNNETPLFHCFTECSETFNVYQLVQKLEGLRGREISFKEAYKIVNGQNFSPEKVEQQEELKVEKKFKHPMKVLLPELRKGVLDLFSISETHPWRMEGIDPYILKEFNIGYSKSYQAVSIPHYDFRGRLIGVRARTYDESKMAKGKYMPLFVNGSYYSHPLSLNLYGITQNSKAIRKARSVYIFEGEKSVLQFQDMFGQKNALAVCGSSISEWQVNMLIHFFKIEKVIFAFDKEYTNYESAYKYVQKIKQKTEHLRLFCDVSVLIDLEGNFKLKESPVDRSVNEFKKLKEWKI